MYEMPIHIKEILENQQVWAFKERIEVKNSTNKHLKLVIKYTSFFSQDTNQDNFQHLYNFFERSVRSLQKWTYVNYVVDCGPWGRPQKNETE